MMEARGTGLCLAHREGAGVTLRLMRQSCQIGLWRVPGLGSRSPFMTSSVVELSICL